MNIETVERIIRWVRDILVIVVCFGAIYLYFSVTAALEDIADSWNNVFGTSTWEEPTGDFENNPDCWQSGTGDWLCAPGGEDGLP